MKNLIKELGLPIVIVGSTDDEVYDSIIAAMSIIHDRYVKDNIVLFTREEDRHHRYRFLPFFLIGWGDAHHCLEPISAYAEEMVENLLGKELEEMKVKAAYIRGVKAYIKKLYIKFDNGPIKLREITRKNLSEVIQRASEAGEFYDVYDVNIDELLAWDDQFRNRLCEQVKNRLAKLA